MIRQQLIGIVALNIFVFVTSYTVSRIASHNYPVEKHDVVTNDGYIITVFRIPFSPRSAQRVNVSGTEVTGKPIVFLQHGLSASSDCWVLNGPDNGLPFMLADAGYDVWLGNSRGNRYGHRHRQLNTSDKEFWRFDWHEIGVIDLPTQIDYALLKTCQTAVHYVGHSQGTTVLLVMLSTMPEYNQKIKTTHLLSPVAFSKHMKSSKIQNWAPLLRNIADDEMLPYNKNSSEIFTKNCRNPILMRTFCIDTLFPLSDEPSRHMNNTILLMLFESGAAGFSTRQLKHYMQLIISGNFSQYDYGISENLLRYRTQIPPKYPLNKINPLAPVELYYSDNDNMVSVEDVLKLYQELHKAQLHHVPFKDWDHTDFLYALEVKEVINSKILNICNDYESHNS